MLLAIVMASASLFDELPGMPPPKKPRQGAKEFGCDSSCGKSNCTKAYTKAKALEAHKQSEFKCDKADCGKTFSEAGVLQKHILSHQQLDHKCDKADCGKIFKTEGGLAVHARWHEHGDFECDQGDCRKIFKTEGGLAVHTRWHEHGDFECDQGDCRDTFKTERGLAEHLKWHEHGDFECDQGDCRETFKTEGVLARHIRWHKAGGYNCEWAGCETDFRNPEVLWPSLSVPPRRLCALHSRLEYTHANTLWPGNSSIDYCTECTAKEGQSICAGFDGPPDANGIALKHQLCSAHAREAGTKSSFTAGASHVACEAYHVLADRLKLSCFKELNLDAGDHFHYSPGEDPTGRELKPFANQSIGVDGTFRDMQGRIIGFYQFHGNYFHGYPPGHPRHLTFGSGHRWGPSLYNNTMNRDFQYMTEPMWDVKTGGAVEAPLFEVWEHDFKAYKKALKIDVNATLKYNRYERIANTVPADVKRAMRDAMHVSEEGEPAGEHIQGGGCELCRAARSRVRGQV